MEKVIREEAIYKTVKKGTKSVDVYVASDGREFIGKGAEKDCENWEAVIHNQKIWDGIEKYLDSKSILSVDEWYHPKTEEELLLVINHINYYDNYNYVFINLVERKKNVPENFFKVGDWIACNYQDGGDYKCWRYIYTLEYVKSTLEFLDELK